MGILLIYLLGCTLSYFYTRYVITVVLTSPHEDDVKVWVICILFSWIGIFFMTVIHLASFDSGWLKNLLYKDKK